MSNTNGSRWMPILFAAALSALLAGAAMVVRGDVIGQRAADRAEARMVRRVDKLETDFKDALREVKESLKRIEDKLDERTVGR